MNDATTTNDTLTSTPASVPGAAPVAGAAPAPVKPPRKKRADAGKPKAPKSPKKPRKSPTTLAFQIGFPNAPGVDPAFEFTTSCPLAAKTKKAARREIAKLVADDLVRFKGNRVRVVRIFDEFAVTAEAEVKVKFS